jgi:hypothetical protein
MTQVFTAEGTQRTKQLKQPSQPWTDDEDNILFDVMTTAGQLQNTNVPVQLSATVEGRLPGRAYTAIRAQWYKGIFPRLLADGSLGAKPSDTGRSDAWTAEEEATIIEDKKNGETTKAIAARLPHKKPFAAQSRWQTLYERERNEGKCSVQGKCSVEGCPTPAQTALRFHGMCVKHANLLPPQPAAPEQGGGDADDDDEVHPARVNDETGGQLDEGEVGRAAKHAKTAAEVQDEEEMRHMRRMRRMQDATTNAEQEVLKAEEEEKLAELQLRRARRGGAR